MKKAALFCMILLLTASLAACSTPQAEPLSQPDAVMTYDGIVESFSWAETLNSDAVRDDAGVKRDGFANTASSKIENSDDALRLAQNEHILQPDESYSISYDKETDMWKVSFFPKGNNVLGGCVDVYLSHEGITQLIIVGE